MMPTIPVRCDWSDPGSLSRSMHHHQVQKPGDEVQHAGLIVGETIVDEPEGAPGALSILCSIQVGFRAEHLLQSVRYGAFDYSEDGVIQ